MSEEFVKGMLEANEHFGEFIAANPKAVFLVVQTNKPGQFFEGSEAKPGDVCELLCVGRRFNEDGLECFSFQLRVKP